ncbi:hypothetical protein [Pedobacter changchengzhani]|uniref:hypothetical protein n=1 Tax=Pedobacter changchengzhani TaxID=2529274 RepID=UPI001FB6B738|nr:hypothetical protein [Pedobacter changchengzhani]
MRKAFTVLILSSCFSVCYAQNVSTINGEPIDNKEFMWAYKKNHNGNTNASFTDLLSFLTQYTNFKLKVLDAKEMGFDKKPFYKEELKNYENALRARNKVNYGKKDFEYLLNEYRDGVLMFNISEEKIWSKAQDDEQALNNYYKLNANNYSKPLDEIRGQVIADFQENLEAEWIKKLRQKYNIKINEREINKLAKP